MSRTVHTPLMTDAVRAWLCHRSDHEDDVAREVLHVFRGGLRGEMLGEEVDGLAPVLHADRATLEHGEQGEEKFAIGRRILHDQHAHARTEQGGLHVAQGRRRRLAHGMLVA